MSNYFKRFLRRFQLPVSLFIGIASAGLVFSVPLKYILIDSQTEEFQNSPGVVKKQEDAEKRKKLIIEKYKQYKECKDPEQKRELFKELSSIHQQRYIEAQRQAQRPIASD